MKMREYTDFLMMKKKKPKGGIEMLNFVGGRNVRLDVHPERVIIFDDDTGIGTHWEVYVPLDENEKYLVLRVSDTDADDGIAETDDIEDIIEEITSFYDEIDENIQAFIGEIRNFD